MTVRADLIVSFQQHYDDLIRFLRPRVGAWDAAEEVAQDTYVRLANVPNSTEIKNLRAYIFRVAANIAIDRGRRTTRISTRQDSDLDLNAVQDQAPSSETSVDLRLRLRHLQSALAELTENQRRAVIMNLVEGRTHAEIAETLGVSGSMVNKYLSKALRHCRDRMREWGQKL